MTRNRLILIAAGGSAALVIGAWIFQALGYAPCKMCYWQRYPHYAAALIGALALMMRGALLPWLGGLAALTTAGIGIYHSGVERKWWLGPTSCTSSGGGISGLSIDQLLDPNADAPGLVLCDEIAWRLSDWIPWDALDITMPNINAAASLALALIWIAAARRS